MSENQKVMYIYDGSFEGFLCCVYNFYYNRLKPAGIISRADFTPSFYENLMIETDYEQVYKVRFAIEEKLGRRNLEFLTGCFLTCLEEKEMYMLRYVVKGFRVGPGIINHLSDRDVSVLFKAHRHLEREQHHFLGWVRFYKAGDVYVSKIEPKNQILPLIAWHFTNRFADQPFMIYDATHKQALIYSRGDYRIIRADDIQMPQVSEDEKRTQQLWKNFYDTIAIKERYNPKCRMNFMPKRTWANLTEMQDQTDNTGREVVKI
ncbi:MAG: TIGR03915 family putative DNA repair protein [Oscillospiraceae bacterium]|nr:TIGR03915 family putative DNA repair protein [Oscillospiraceae bacterium]